MRTIKSRWHYSHRPRPSLDSPVSTAAPSTVLVTRVSPAAQEAEKMSSYGRMLADREQSACPLMAGCPLWASKSDINRSLNDITKIFLLYFMLYLIIYLSSHTDDNGASQVAKNLPSGKESACQCKRARDVHSIPGSGNPPGGGNSNPLRYSWTIPWTEEPGGLQSRELQRVRDDWSTEHSHTSGKHHPRKNSKMLHFSGDTCGRNKQNTYSLVMSAKGGKRWNYRDGRDAILYSLWKGSDTTERLNNNGPLQWRCPWATKETVLKPGDVS